MIPASRPALERRARYAELQPKAVRRRSVRVLSRLAVIILFDVMAFLAARSAASRVIQPVTVPASAAASFTSAGPLAPPGAPASLVFPVLLFVGLVFSGSYARHRVFVGGLRVFAATVGASLATGVALATLVGVRSGVIYAGMFGLVSFLALLAGRAAAHAFLRFVWPRGRGAFPAVRLHVGSEPSASPSRNWGDYLFVADVRLENDTSPSQDIEAVFNRLHESSLNGAEALIIRDDLADSQLMPLVHGALDLGYRIIFPARAVPAEGIRPRLIWYGGAPFFEISTPALRASAVLTKRITDVIGAALLLVMSAPVMAVISILIRLDSRGSVLFTQDRAGLGGARFRMLKFRTMTVDADQRKSELVHLNRSTDVRLFKIPGDPRVTRVGRHLRQWSLDELPQLINVLRGEMSLVGPRPFFESDLSDYEDRHFRRLDTKPGITGLWQVSGGSDLVEFEDVVFLDREYIEHWSLWLDLSILARTVPAVLRRRGEY